MTGLGIARIHGWKWGLAAAVPALLTSLVVVATLPGLAQPGPAPAVGSGGPVRITGRLKLVIAGTSDIAAAPAIATIAMPDQRVVLRGIGGIDVATAPTMLDGRFDIVAPTRGRYQICWAISGSTGCSKVISALASTVGAEDVLARVDAPILYGTSLTGDGRPCWINDSFFDLDVATEVAAGGRKARANIYGEYAIVGLAPGRYQVSAACEKARATAPAAVGGGATRVDLPLPNRAPRLTAVFASNGTKAVTRVAAGSQVKLTAEGRDPDGDDIKYRWYTLEGGSIGGGRSEGWRPAASSGLNSAYVIARDGNGGYAFRRFDIRTGSLNLDFSGHVLDEASGAPLADASVSVGAASARTNAAGWFSLKAAPRSDDRYVLNISHPQHAPISRVYDKDATGATYEMIRAQVQMVRPGRTLEIVDRSSSGPCGADARGKRVRHPARLVKPGIYRAETEEPDAYGALATRQRAEAALLAAAAKPVRCDPRGVELRIPKNALVDSGGRTPRGRIRAASASLNPARRAIPGDYQALTAAGSRAELRSYGAVYAEFTDASGNRLELRPGTTAEVRVPVPDEARPGAPRTLAFWSYDRIRGVWVEEGVGTLTRTSSGWYYIARTRHFSELNMDVAGTDPDHATCVRVELGSDFSGWSNLRLRAYVSYGGAPPPQVKETALDSQQYHAIFRIPFNTGFPNSLRLELRGTLNGIQVVLLDNIINTDAPPHHAMTTDDLWPDPPYLDCTPVVLTAEPGVIPPYGDIDGFGRPAFLVGASGAFNPDDGLQQATDYYAALDVPTPKSKLGDWWDANGFDANGGGVAPNFVQAAYLNHNDLGFGRNMHCLRNGAKLACYVTNYGLPDQNPDNADDALAQTNPGATVAMEYDDAPAVPGQNVQFFVYGAGAQRDSQRLKFADLDGFGPKPVPALCQICHGGGPGLAANKRVADAHFREFDLPSFKYPGGRSWDYGVAIGATTPSAAEFNAFAALNQMVRGTNGFPGAPNEIANLITGWYGNGAVLTGQPAIPPTPTSWTGNSSEYRFVYGATCRTCHIARAFPDFVGANGLATFQSSYAVSKVCGEVVDGHTVRVMPNASITYRNFWADSPRVSMYETLVGRPVGSCKG